ncbi:polysaccharide biosynthesis/export family protein [Aureliella helgolandensis]|uniref:Polysaccharide biosynthesis/export protein n=1 Tax=Aureliella helgolandensis TaxID=2527968 RepID=A0A518GE28_9BACT|nr:polysaccharide biosynthesis/export family protein [Aureliella helgolandensis]QDV26852.1 Polysaccharide biosynthesis/export protein [Aureliella helgolandensis]
MILGRNTCAVQRIAWSILVLMALPWATGCSTFTFRIKGTPACSLPIECRAESKRYLERIDVTRLTQLPPDHYRLAAGDIIGVTLDGVIPLRGIDDPPQLAPVHFPEAGSNLPPAIGIPVVVQDSGSITLPALQPFSVDGLTLEETAEQIRQTYLDRGILKSENTFPIVTLIKARTVNVTVIREDTGGTVAPGANDRDATGGRIQLEAYHNDVLTALMQTGGLPGLRAKNEIRIYRNGGSHSGMYIPAPVVDAMEVNQSFPTVATTNMDGPETIIPLRIPRGSPINFAPEDVLLHEGDVVYVPNRDTEVFYTAGLLPGGEHLLPRDYDVDIFEAMAIAGYSYGNSQSGGGGGMVPATGVIPSQLFVFRELPNGSEYTIEVDLEKAVALDCERIYVKPGDKLLLRYSPTEEALNFGIFSFFTYGIRELFR